MEGKRVAQPSRLFANSLLESKDEFEDKYEKCYGLLKGLTEGKGERECNDALNTAVARDTKSHEDVCIGFIIAILVEPENASKHYRHLTLMSKDGLHFVLQELNKLVLEKFLKLKESVRTQVLWFTKEMIKNQVQNIDGLCWVLMRQIAGGDVNQKNLWLADSLMDIFMESRSWLEKYPFLLASVVYTYLRVIEDHAHVNLSSLRNKEVNFVVGLIRDRFNDVLVIGRDLVRLLQNIARIPEIEELWNDILYNPTNLAPTFTGLVQIMSTRTSRRFLQSRITPDMEKKLVFLTSQVRFGSHKRYQDWFQRTYLATLESQTLRCDLIRFIVGVIHPTNELLCSDIIPRWAVIGWLLTTCTNQVAASNAKLALFYDWLFYDQDRDNIMNIEPAILVMHHSMRPHPAITATLLDFLCRIIHNFCPAEAEKVRNGIYSSLRQIVEKRVLPSLSPLFDSQRLDRELRTMLKERFGAFLSKEEEEKGDPLPIIDKDDHYSQSSEPGPAFSDDDDDSQDSLPGAYDKPVQEVKEETVASRLSPPLRREEEVAEAKPEVKSEPNHARRNSNNHLSTNGERDLELDQEVVDKLSELADEGNCERRCEVMEQLVQVIISEQVEDENARQVAEKLSDILKDQFEGKVFPENPTPENIEDSIGQPLFVMFRSLCEISEIDPARTPVLTVLAELYGLQPRLGYYLLYYLKAYNKLDSKSRSSLYKDLMLTIDDNNSLDICLVNDMRQCQEDDVALFVWLCPDIYTYFQKAAIGNVDLLYLVVSCVDGRQIETLICHIIARDFIMFKKDSFQPVISASLTWETFEQFALWQLLSGHDLPVDCLLPLLPKLSYDSHAEALTHIMILLKREKPTAELVKHLMSREPRPKDRFVTSVLTCWINDYEEKLGDLLGSQLCKQSSPAGGKRKRTAGTNSKNGLGALAEMTLTHLDNLRQTCRQYDLFNTRAIQQALNTVRSLCTDTQKKKFMDLFALADSESEDESLQKPKASSKSKQPSSKSPAKPKPKNSGGGSVAHTESSGESSETEEEVVETTVPAKKTGKGRGSKPVAGRKRAVVSKVSYKDIPSTDYSSEDDEGSRNTPKKKKKMKMSASDSD